MDNLDFHREASVIARQMVDGALTDYVREYQRCELAREPDGTILNIEHLDTATDITYRRIMDSLASIDRELRYARFGLKGDADAE